MGILNYLKEKYEQAPTTSSTLFGEWRRGLKDLQDLVLQAFPESHKSRDEPGTTANPTIQEVFRDRKDIDTPGKAPEQSREVQPEQQREKDREPELG
jgi:hypothetical protein